MRDVFERSLAEARGALDAAASAAAWATGRRLTPGEIARAEQPPAPDRAAGPVPRATAYRS